MREEGERLEEEEIRKKKLQKWNTLVLYFYLPFIEKFYRKVLHNRYLNSFILHRFLRNTFCILFQIWLMILS